MQSPTGRRTRIPDFTGTERESEHRVMRENDTPADKNDDAPRGCIWSLRFFSQGRTYRISKVYLESVTNQNNSDLCWKNVKISKGGFQGLSMEHY